MSRHIGIVVVALIAAVVVAAPVPKQLKKGDHGAILGEWYEPADKARMWYFNEDGTAGGGDLPEPKRKGQYKIDPNTTPKSLDWSDDGGKTWQLGVYSIEDGVLTVNIGRESKDPRPTSLDENARTYKITAARKKD
jgi:uncharacterized protein (TIGR03067 family)